MAIRKSDLYASIWASCDELRGGSDVGDRINTQIIQPLIDANDRLARTDFPDFNDPNKLGEGQAMVDRLSNLIGIFQKPELDFSQNRAEHDDILGDAYEYLMRHFATESGKSKGQFYTPSEVSRVIAQVIGISPRNTKASTTAYDPTAGSGSLVLKVAAQAGKHITLEGQEKDVTTAGLARMNMILHDFPTASILSGFQTAAIRQQFLFYAVGTKVSGISKTNIPKLTLPVLSIAEQIAIAAVLADMDAELSALEARRDKTRSLKQAMTQELLTGKTRLI